MSFDPIYHCENVNNPAYHLRYSWTGWPSSEKFPEPSAELFHNLDPLWEKDGLRRLEQRWDPWKIQILFSATPRLTPILCTSRVKGRLQYELRQLGTPTKFSRKVSFQTVGNNTTEVVQQYIEKQTSQERIADPGLREFLKQFTVVVPEVDLDVPTATLSGRYWYNLHLVLVTQERYPVTDAERLPRLRDGSFEIASEEGHTIKILSVMPEHLHISMRGNIERSPEDIALAFMNGLAIQVGYNAIWRYGYYVGSFGRYNMQAIRRCADKPIE